MGNLFAPTRGMAVLLALGLTAFAFSALPVASASTNLPAWSVGDSWTYSENGLALPFPSRGTLKYVVRSTDTIADNSTSISTYHAELWANYSGGAPYHAADEWYRMSDLAVVRLNLNVSYCFPGFPPACSNTTILNTMDPPLPIHFPLTPGSAWSASTRATHEVLNRDNGVATWYNGTGWANDSVESDAPVSVPAGNFTVSQFVENYSRAGLALSLSYGSLILRDFASTVGNVVRERDYLGFDPHTGTWGPHLIAEMQLESYSYSPPWYDLKIVGLPVWSWLIVAAAVVLGVAFVLLRRRRGKVGPAPPSEPPRSPAPPAGPPAKPL